jgi:predicted GNAT family acetyltransferase
MEATLSAPRTSDYRTSEESPPTEGAAAEVYARPMATAVRDNPERERYDVHEDGMLAGFAQYRRRGTLIAFIHTEVDPSFEGRGVGTALIKGALDDARAQGLDVLPFCPFVRSYIEHHADYLDLVPESRRKDFEL